jgi:hypothetical protein
MRADWATRKSKRATLARVLGATLARVLGASRPLTGNAAPGTAAATSRLNLEGKQRSLPLRLDALPQTQRAAGGPAGEREWSSQYARVGAQELFVRE